MSHQQSTPVTVPSQRKRDGEEPGEAAAYDEVAGARARMVALRIRVRQLCGGGMYGDVPFWVMTTWCGVRLDTAWRWLTHCGWGGYTMWRHLPPLEVEGPKGKPRIVTCAQDFQVQEFAPLRLHLKGRCWIEDVDRRATSRLDGQPFESLTAIARGQALRAHELQSHIDRLRSRRRRKTRAAEVRERAQ